MIRGISEKRWLFFLNTGDRYGIDSLAGFYHRKFSSLQVGSKVKTICGKGEQLPFRAETFNLIICDNVLDHTINPELVIKETQYVLKKNCVLFLGVDVHSWAGHLLSLIHERLIGQFIILKWFGSHPFYFRYKDSVAGAGQSCFNKQVSNPALKTGSE